LVAEKVKSGIITVAQAKQEKDRHKLTRCIGIGEQSAIQTYQPIKGKCRLVICSDGLTDKVADAEIENALIESGLTAKVADELLNLALERGGRDNVTIIVADVSESVPIISGITNKLWNWRKI
jgi:protein phosphatase